MDGDVAAARALMRSSRVTVVCGGVKRYERQRRKDPYYRWKAGVYAKALSR